MSTPAHAVKNTKSMKKESATGNPARPQKNLAIPAAASPKRRLKMQATPADTGRAATEKYLVFTTALKKVKFPFFDRFFLLK
jgi:hypothetical protein